MQRIGSGHLISAAGYLDFPPRLPRLKFLGPGEDTVLACYVHELYDGQRMRPEKLAAWRALRERYGNRDESRVDRGSLQARAS